MAPHSSTLAWKIPWMEEPGRLQSMESLGVGHDWVTPSDLTFTFHFYALKREMATHSSVLAWRTPGMAEPGGLLSMGSHSIRHNWSDLAAAAVDREILHISTKGNSLYTKSRILNQYINYPFENKNSHAKKNHFLLQTSLWFSVINRAKISNTQ